MGNFGVYTGEEFFALKLKKRDWLVEGILKEKDSVILVGDEKAGKSLFVFQLICSLTSTHPFLDTYKVPRECKVSYVQIEGELEDSQDRFNKMIQSIDMINKNFQIFFVAPLELQASKGLILLKRDIERCHKPDVIIIDPIYFAFTGSLSDDMVVRQFIGNIRKLKEYFDCSIILVHHTHKMRLNKEGKIIAEGDEAIFGSKFLKAYPDHTILFAYDKRNETRIMSCGTQRSGDIVKSLRLKLNEPDPLYFEPTEMNPTNESVVLTTLMKEENLKTGLSQEEITKEAGLSRNAFYASVKPLLRDKVVRKTGGRPVHYIFVGRDKKQDEGNT